MEYKIAFDTSYWLGSVKAYYDIYESLKSNNISVSRSYFEGNSPYLIIVCTNTIDKQEFLKIISVLHGTIIQKSEE